MTLFYSFRGPYGQYPASIAFMGLFFFSVFIFFLLPIIFFLIRKQCKCEESDDKKENISKISQNDPIKMNDDKRGSMENPSILESLPSSDQIGERDS